MSSYQYYEFQAIDKPLTEKEQEVIGGLSSRVILSPTQAIFSYSYGDFRGDASKVLEKYFDAMLYLASWGSKQLIFRFPIDLIDIKELKLYQVEDKINIRKTKSYVILEVSFMEEEGGGWLEGEGCLDTIIKLRNDLMMGDYRMLYLIWLKANQYLNDNEKKVISAKITILGNFKKLSAPLEAFIDLFEIPDKLIKEAANKSKNQSSKYEVDIETLIPLLSEKEKNRFLMGLANEEQNLNLKLKKRLKELSTKE